MTVRAKFVCNWKTKTDTGGGQQITLSPVYSGSEENKAFYSATPGGTISLYSVNPAATASFEQGKEYYVDFTPATS